MPYYGYGWDVRPVGRTGSAIQRKVILTFVATVQARTVHHGTTANKRGAHSDGLVLAYVKGRGSGNGRMIRSNTVLGDT